jgi:hypothetical protein
MVRLFAFDILNSSHLTLIKIPTILLIIKLLSIIISFFWSPINIFKHVIGPKIDVK